MKLTKSQIDEIVKINEACEELTKICSLSILKDFDNIDGIYVLVSEISKVIDSLKDRRNNILPKFKIGNYEIAHPVTNIILKYKITKIKDEFLWIESDNKLLNSYGYIEGFSTNRRTIFIKNGRQCTYPEGTKRQKDKKFILFPEDIVSEL